MDTDGHDPSLFVSVRLSGSPIARDLEKYNEVFTEGVKCWRIDSIGHGRTRPVSLCFGSTERKSSSETQGQLVGAGERLNRRGKKSGEEKSKTKVGAPGILLLTDQFRNHLKSLPVIGHKNIFCAQSEFSSFRVTFVTSYSKLSAQTSCSPVRRLFNCSCRRVSLGRKVPLKREL